ncbi:MAG: hypothetical protein JW725_01600 [Candidatus Babeliaceae bacterium]|nr:hypothetical protein [Candidatus Babeliaceae bacterium]
MNRNLSRILFFLLIGSITVSTNLLDAQPLGKKSNVKQAGPQRKSFTRIRKAKFQKQPMVKKQIKFGIRKPPRKMARPHPRFDQYKKVRRVPAFYRYDPSYRHAYYARSGFYSHRPHRFYPYFYNNLYWAYPWWEWGWRRPGIAIRLGWPFFGSSIVRTVYVENQEAANRVTKLNALLKILIDDLSIMQSQIEELRTSITTTEEAVERAELRAHISNLLEQQAIKEASIEKLRRKIGSLAYSIES